MSFLTGNWDDETPVVYADPPVVDTSKPRINAKGVDTNRIRVGDTVVVFGQTATVTEIDAQGRFEISGPLYNTAGQLCSRSDTRWTTRPCIAKHTPAGE